MTKFFNKNSETSLPPTSTVWIQEEYGYPHSIGTILEESYPQSKTNPEYFLAP